ncbi:MAG: hypothetical protein LBP29_08870, partial [Treponema sp.]|nr:hypothetical protein [Treponema sp.]
MIKIAVTLNTFAPKPEPGQENRGLSGTFRADSRRAVMEFHIRREIRERHGLEHSLFSLSGNVVLADTKQARALTAKLNAGVDPV